MVIFGMREHFPDVELLPVIVNYSDDTKIVAAHVKYGVRRHIVGRIERLLDLGEIVKAGCTCEPVPCLQRRFGDRVFKPEGFNRFFGNDMHGKII